MSRSPKLAASLSGLALALALGLVGCRKPATRHPRPSVATLTVVRGQTALRVRDDRTTVLGNTRVPREAELETSTSGRSMLTLDTGAFVLLDRGTTVRLDLGRIELRSGRIFVDARGAASTTIETADGTLVLADSAVSVTRTTRTEAYAAAGEIAYRSPRGADRFVQGETLVLSGAEPAVEPAAVFDDWTGGLSTPSLPLPGRAGFIGEIDARPQSTRGVAGEPMSLRSHEVVARVQDDLVETETVQTFFNGESETVDGDYRMRVQEGAVVSRFEIDRGAGYEPSMLSPVGDSMPVEGAAMPVGNARLAYDGPDRFRARILAVAPGQILRVKVVTTSWLSRRDGIRTLVVPLAGDASPPLVGELSIRVDASASGASRVAAGYGASTAGKSVSHRANDIRPRADFVVELVDEEPRTDARAYVGSRSFEHGRIQRFVRVDVPTERLLDDAPPSRGPLDLLVVLDTSGGTDPEDLELARATLETLLAQAEPEDRIAVRAADVTLHALAGSATEPTRLDAAARERLLDAIATVETGGATDLGTVLREASSALAGHDNGVVLYLGDGLPTDGAMSATGIRRELELVDDPPRLFAIGLGDDANLGMLRALAGEFATVVQDREHSARQVLALLAEAGRPVLRDLTIDLGETVEQLHPRNGRVIAVGDSTSVVARLEGASPSTLRVRARFGDRTLERSFPIVVREEIGRDDVARRWASHRLRELLDADAGREAIVELGLGYDLVTPFTPRVVGLGIREELVPWRGLDDAARETAWAIGGGSTGLARFELGERRGHRAYEEVATTPRVALESTWTEHEASALANTVSAPAAGDGGLAMASVRRVLAHGARGPQGCFERKLLQRPDLMGEVIVRLTVDGSGQVTASSIVRSTLGVEDVDRCVLDEVTGLAFPGTAGASVTVDHSFVFTLPQRRIGIPHRCSTASERDLGTRRRLWAERIEVARQNGVGVSGLLTLFRDAQSGCELGDWRARRTLATMLLDALPGLDERLDLYRSFADDPVVAPYLRREILRNLSNASEVARARVALGLDPSLDWTLFARAFAAASSKEQKLALVRRWLEVAPEDIDLRLRLLTLLEETGKLPEARRVAHALHVDPLCDARARTRVGEFWLRTGDRERAVRVFSELVERAPLDPWARRRLGDLYLAHGFLDDARREYETLSRLRPDDSTNLLLLARAAAAAGRTDEALRLEQRVSEEADDDVEEGLSAVARAFTTVRLSRLRAEARDPAMRAALDDRLRSTGVLRRPPAVVVSLVWDHPDDQLVLGYRGPDAADDAPYLEPRVVSPELGIASFRIVEREPGRYRVRVERSDTRDLRETRATLVVTEGLGTPNERTTTREITLRRDAPRQEIDLDL